MFRGAGGPPLCLENHGVEGVREAGLLAEGRSPFTVAVPRRFCTGLPLASRLSCERALYTKSRLSVRGQLASQEKTRRKHQVGLLFWREGA